MVIRMERNFAHISVKVEDLILCLDMIKMALSRLCEEQIIRRVMRGVYEYVV